MKTTIDLPDETMIQAKVFAAQNKMTLKDLFLRGIQREMQRDNDQNSSEALVNALGQGHNTSPVGKLLREEIYDRRIIR